MTDEAKVFFQPSTMRMITEGGDAYISVSDLVGNINMLRMEISEKAAMDEFAVAVEAMSMILDSVTALLIKAESETHD